MSNVREVFDYIDSFAPFDTQMQWDNSGMLVGDMRKDIRKIGVVLDITPQVIVQAAVQDIDLIVSHHPVIFKAQKSFTTQTLAYQLAINNISAICAHTSLDSADGGVNDVLAGLLELKHIEPIATHESDNLLRAGFVKKMSAIELATLVADTLGSDNYALRYCDGGKPIETVAVCGGSGSDFIDDVISADIDAYITGDAGYHDFLDAAQKGLTLISAGHFETENPVVRVLAQKLSKEFENVEVVVINQSTPVKYFVISD